jgi:hypothetical protein
LKSRYAMPNRVKEEIALSFCLSDRLRVQSQVTAFYCHA